MKKINLLLLIFFFAYNSAFTYGLYVSPPACYDLISYSDNNFYSAYISNSENECYFIITKKDGSRLIVPDDNIIHSIFNGADYPAVKILFPFWETKFNVVPFLHQQALIKVLYLLNKVNFRPRVSDAMRTNENQLLYKKRGWSRIESSPHLIGLAMDLAYTPPEDKKKILSLIEDVGIYYLEHGGRGNRHVHLQDNNIWNLETSKVANALSDDLLEKAIGDNSIMRSVPIEEKSSSCGTKIFFSFKNEKPGMVKVYFYDNLGNEKAFIETGIFETGTHSMFIDDSILRKGNYRVMYFVNDVRVKEQVYAKVG